ncbi:hypothetical protein FSP39_025099 [Pinctada imbricata]|uniref:SHSP domain-containing protein n=1 Tax=Pinctada imbricata TaxID=66713 RepID=A0AA88YFU0_PINIB|nr:hypothetical protein FSP39_025099 [Pinctada imbricata]
MTMATKVIPLFCRQLKCGAQPARYMSFRRDLPVRFSPFSSRNSLWRKSPLDSFFGPSTHMRDIMDSQLQEMQRMMDRFQSPRFFDAYFTRPSEAGDIFKTDVAEVKIDKDQMNIKMDVQHYTPEDLTVKIVGDKLVIAGKHETKPDEHGYISRQFQREFLIPENIDLDSLKTTLTEDGMLNIQGKSKDVPKVEERTIEIEVRDEESPKESPEKKRKIENKEYELFSKINGKFEQTGSFDVPAVHKINDEGQSNEHRNKGTPNRSESVDEQMLLQNRLTSHFNDPFTKVFKTCSPENKGRRIRKFFGYLPYRFLIIAFKWIFVSWQLIAFANDRSQFAKYLERNNIAMKNLLLKDWITFYETMPYPPATGTYAIYTVEDLVSSINHTLHKISTIPTSAAGSFFVDNNSTTTPITICITYFDKGFFDQTQLTLDINEETVTDCNTYNNTYTENFGFDPTIQDLMQSTDGRLVRLIEVRIRFSVISVHVKLNDGSHKAECYRIETEIVYDNGDINGQILINFNTRVQALSCKDIHQSKKVETDSISVSVIVLLLSMASLIFGIKSTLKSFMLCLDAGRIFTKHGMELTMRGRYQIFKVKNIIIIISDVVNITGTVMKVLLESKGTDSSDLTYDACAILLGIGCFCVWLGIIHYLSYDKLFSLLFDVVESSLMTVLRFMVVALLLFAGFGLCGWAVLGPYHIKFETITSSFQCLFSLLNGDEIFVTLKAVADIGSIAYYFNGLFVTVFVVIYTLIALNIFIAIFNTSYENVRNVKMQKKEVKTQSDLERFLGREQGEPLFHYTSPFSEKLHPRSLLICVSSLWDGSTAFLCHSMVQLLLLLAVIHPFNPNMDDSPPVRTD